MTCIIALKNPDGSVIFGSDRAATAGQEKSTSPFPKIWAVGDFLMGGSGGVRGFGLARHVFTPPERGDYALYGYLVKSFGPALRELFKEHDLVGPREGYTGSFCDSEFLVAAEGRIFRIWSDFSVTEEDSYAAIGSGAHYALGALYVNYDHKQPQARVFSALSAAQKHCPSVDGPFDYLELDSFGEIEMSAVRSKETI